MEKDLMLIMSITGCLEDEAKKAYFHKNGDVLLAIDFIMFGNNPPPAPKKRKREDINEHEQHLNSMRSKMEQMDSELENRQSTTSNPLDCEEQGEKPDPHEEMAQQNNCFQECQIPSMEEAARKQGTAYQQHPVYSYDFR
jgi:hypothetical protein